MLSRTTDNVAGHLTLLGSMLGLIGALVVMPANTQPAGAISQPAIILTVGMLAGAVYDITANGIARALRAEHLVVISAIYFVMLEPIQGLYPMPLSSETVQAVFVMVGIFGAACGIGSSVKALRLPRFVWNCAVREFSSNVLFRLIIVCFLIGMFDFAFFSDFSLSKMMEGLRAGRGLAPWNRTSLGGWNAFADFMPYIGYVIPTLTVMIAVQRRSWINRYVIWGCLLSGIFLAFVSQLGGRRVPGAIIGSAVVTWVCMRRSSLRAFHLAILLCLAGIMLLLFDSMLTNRDRGFGQFSFNVNEVPGIRVDNNFLFMGHVADIFPRTYPHLGFQWITFVLVRPVPRILWPDKPVDPGFDLAIYLRERGVTYSCSVIGEWYMAFGWLGVFIGGLGFGYAARSWSQLLDHDVPVAGIGLYGLGLMSFIVGVRSFYEVVLMNYPLLCWLFINKLSPAPDRPIGVSMRTLSRDVA
jgi:oligosaccharide repeat unit polymerase